MLPLPPLNFANSSSLNSAGASFGVGNGDWTVNLGGSGGPAVQSAAVGSALPNWVLPALVLGAAWLLLHKKL